MAIQMRRGNAANYDETKMLAGEVAVVKDSEQVFVSFGDGSAEELLLKKDVPSVDGSAIVVDSALSTTSTNPVQNKVIAEKIRELEESISAGGGGSDSTDIPDTLPNPHALTFTGAVSATYDGSEAVTVNIPAASSGGNSGTTIVDSATTKYLTTITGDGSTKAFTVTHNLGHQHVFTQIFDSANNLVHADVNCVSEAAITVTFATAPTSSTTYTVLVLAFGTVQRNEALDEYDQYAALNISSWTEGYYLNSGTPAVNASYSYCDYIDVTDISKIKIVNNHYATYAFYDADGNRIANTSAYGVLSSPATTVIDVYSGATYFRYSCFTTDIGVDSLSADNGIAYLLRRDIPNNDGTVLRGALPSVTGTKESLTNNGTMRITGLPHIKFELDLTFSAKVTSFAGMTITHGNNVYNGSMVKVDASNITVYRYTDALNAITTQAHGLTISDFINVTVKVGFFSARIIVSSASGTFMSDEVTWYGARAELMAYAYSGTTMTDCELRWNSNALKHGIWWFGDSYLDTYPIALNQYGYDNALFDAFSGRASEDAWNSLQTELTYNNPNTIVWGMGMNNADTDTAISATWQEYAQKLIQLCQERRIELIFLTIPNTPGRNNTFKNAFIKASGCRYIDIAECVGASSAGSGWYSGLLGEDGVHPTETGWRVIASYITTQLPQLRSEA